MLLCNGLPILSISREMVAPEPISIYKNRFCLPVIRSAYQSVSQIFLCIATIDAPPYFAGVNIPIRQGILP